MRCYETKAKDCALKKSDKRFSSFGVFLRFTFRFLGQSWKNLENVALHFVQVAMQRPEFSTLLLSSKYNSFLKSSHTGFKSMLTERHLFANNLLCPI